MDKYREIADDWNYDGRLALASTLVSGVAHFKRLIFVVQRIHHALSEGS
jgi:hypothetical protein